MTALVWYVASVVVLTAAVFWKLGRASGLVDGYEQGYDAGRVARADELLAATDGRRALRIVDPPPVDGVARGWVDA